MKRFAPAVLLLLIALAYPRRSHVEEQDLGEAQRYHHRIDLTEDTEENRTVRLR